MPDIKLKDSALPNVISLIKNLESEYPIDPQRIYLIGCSDGGTAAYAAAAFYNDIFAAAVPISGGWDARDASKMIHVPLWIMNGSDDHIIPPEYGRDIAEIVKSFGGYVTYKEFSGVGHECPNDLYYSDERMWDWLFSQKKAHL